MEVLQQKEKTLFNSVNEALFIWVDPLLTEFELNDDVSDGAMETMAKALVNGAKIIVTSHYARINCGKTPEWSRIHWCQRSTSDAWDDESFEAEITVAQCSRCIVVGDFVTLSVTSCVLGALKRGYDVYFLNQADPDISTWNVWAAAVRLSQAGAVPMCWPQVNAELEVKFSLPE